MVSESPCQIPETRETAAESPTARNKQPSMQRDDAQHLPKLESPIPISSHVDGGRHEQCHERHWSLHGRPHEHNGSGRRCRLSVQLHGRSILVNTKLQCEQLEQLSRPHAPLSVVLVFQLLFFNIYFYYPHFSFFV